MKRRRRFGDRKEGRLLRTLPPMNKVSPYVMTNRIGAQNLIHDSIDIENIENYIKKKRQEGLENFGVLHVIVASYIRAVSQRPGINRFIAGYKIYSRNNIDVIMTVKTKMSLEAAETEIKLRFKPDATADDVYRAFIEKVSEAKANEQKGESSFDKTARVLNYIPGFVLKFTISFLRLMDFFGWLPNSLLDVSPFHGSVVLTSMGSLGIPPIYHHLYDFGTVPVFIAYGSKKQDITVDKDNGIKTRKLLDYTVSTDERICDGFYFASALKVIRNCFKNPYILDTPPSEIIEDID